MTETLHSEIEIAAPQATVFAFLTDPDKILRWIGTKTTIEPHPGGIYLVNMNDTHIARGQFTEVIPVHRLAYSFGWEGNEAVPPGSGLIEIDLVEKDGGTLVRLTHSGLPDEKERLSHEEGWAHYLRRLAVAAAGGDPGPDTM
ncbi:SRPBCC domain-containing protein [Pararhizobium sp. BT-229]|uniref:SRPBCC family protein n=1 Tax=Pararhizobium sp. BT-229 TaxID=2986923 RepID=UPI0021F743E5|nr:SRPBCC family protein [Pararhizobium sp. BT-229]MCV9963348.1 SRPBCC domain-containing protein [Pararhizobium sp. BT-229]